MTRIVVMGVSGCGKSTIGSLLADRLGVPFLDADDLHPPSNVAKMAAGIPLTDEDRWPWLRLVGAELQQAPNGVVVACSALRYAYRALLRSHAPDLLFVHLKGSREELASRLSDRVDHFMPLTLLDSQLATLEPLRADERGITLDCALPAGDVLRKAMESLSSR